MPIKRSRENLVCAAIQGILGMAATLWLSQASAVTMDAQTLQPVRVKTVHPKAKENFGPYLEQPATVEPYYSIKIFSDVAGRIISMPKEVGQAVTKDELLAVVAPAGGKSPPVSIFSPLTGLISSRSANPGDFAVNPAVVPGASEIVSVLRNDIVTVNVRVPDTEASQIRLETPAYFRPEGSNGRPFRLSISRITPSLQAGDRTIGVEMDVFNLGENEYAELLSRNASKVNNEFKGGVIPQFPETFKGTQGSISLMPGTYGLVRFDLKSADGGLTLPASCIIMKGGVANVMKVDSGRVVMRPVAILQDDGVYVSASWVDKDPQSGMRITLAMRTEDEVVLSNQGELEEGQLITAVPTDW